MHTKNSAKKALDAIIRKSRVHLYKPIQIAEILFQQRTRKNLDLKDLESYRNISKHWRDKVSLLLVGSKSSSSQKYQDNIFEENAMPPRLLAKLGEMNKEGNGVVEAYIYKALKKRLLSVCAIDSYISSSTAKSFSLKELINLFQTDTGLSRSKGKIYEISVYALFATIMRSLKAEITLEIKNQDQAILEDFKQFIQMVLGVDDKKTQITLPADLYRAGVANAADRGLDILANFGPAIQVKHMTLTMEMAEDIAGSISADRIIIVCLSAEQKIIESLLGQIGWRERIQGVITIDDLDDWYRLCLNKKYEKSLGQKLLKDLRREFAEEFPLIREIGPFMKKRGYNKIFIPEKWRN